MGTHRERSRCPIAYSLDLLGDRWTLLILRDLAFKNRRHFRDFLAAPEGISSNILTARLRRLEEAKLVVKVDDPGDRRRTRYFLTDDGLDLLPVLVELLAWGSRRHPDPNPSAERVAEITADRDGAVRRYRERHVEERRMYGVPGRVNHRGERKGR